MHNFRIILLVTFLGYFNVVFAQLPYFTQFSENQLNINPALAGNYEGDTKFNSLYKYQSYNKILTTNFLNAEAQFKPFKDYISPEDVFAVGIDMYSTKSLSVYSQNSFSGTFSYSKGLNSESSEALALGFQFRYNSKRIDYTKLLFPNQFSITGFTNQLSNNEPINVLNSNYFDINTGILYTNFNDDESFEAGLGVYNLNQVSTEQKNLQLRYGRTYMAHIGYSRYLSSSNQLFVGGLYSYLNTGNSLSLIAGYSLSPEFTNSVGIDFGLVYQANNSFSPYLKLNANSLKFIFSYDVPMEPNISYLQNSRSMELGIQCSFSKISDNITMSRKHVSCFR